MTYDEAISYWYDRIDFERRSPKTGDLKLDRMRGVLRLLGDPHRRFRIVHIAGTKGKGSTSAMLASVLSAAGYRVGLFTSPHLADVRERIQVNGAAISHEELAARMGEIAAAIEPLERSGDPLKIPTFFEIGTALGFLHFDCRRVDVAVVEVGLGGRFDSTNVCRPILSLITNISFDHMAALGDRISLIAREKAGIIKPRCPVITTAEASEALAVFEQIAAQRHSPLTAIGRDFRFDYEPGKLLPPHEMNGVKSSTIKQTNLRQSVVGSHLPRVHVVTKQSQWPWLELALSGKHQAANAAGVVVAVEHLRKQGFVIEKLAVARGLANVQWPARLEVVGTWPLVILDCAHNVASAQALIDTIDDSFAVAGKKRLVFAISNDKQVSEMLQLLGSKFARFYLTRYANNPRCMPPEQIAELLRRTHPAAGISIHQHADEALASATAAAGVNDLIAITGSVFLAGELRSKIVQAPFRSCCPTDTSVS